LEALLAIGTAISAIVVGRMIALRDRRRERAALLRRRVAMVGVLGEAAATLGWAAPRPTADPDGLPCHESRGKLHGCPATLTIRGSGPAELAIRVRVGLPPAACIAPRPRGRALEDVFAGVARPAGDPAFDAHYHLYAAPGVGVHASPELLAFVAGAHEPTRELHLRADELRVIAVGGATDAAALVRWCRGGATLVARGFARGVLTPASSGGDR
jgi:hypothetical protein